MLAVYRLADPLPNEKVIKVMHRDAFIALKRVLLFALLLSLPIALIAMINNLFPTLADKIWAWPALLLALSAYIFFIWLLFFFSLIDYILDVWIITDQRIIDVRQNGFFSRSVSEVQLSRVQDVSSEVHGFWPTVIKFGNVIVQTASEKNELFIEEVAHPERIRDILVELMSKEKTNSSHKEV